MAKKLYNRLTNRLSKNETIDLLIKNSDKFDAGNPFPIESVRVKRLIARFPDKKEDIAEYAQGAYPIVHEDVLTLMEDFLEHKRVQGSNIEKAIYKDMDIPGFVDRLFKKRPLVFCGARDLHLLRGNDGKGCGGFEAIGRDGQERAPRIMKNYITYEEMKISALLGCSTHSLAINRGDRNNKGLEEKIGSFEGDALIVGLVGPRLHKSTQMEAQEIIIREETIKESLECFTKLYGIQTFPSYADITSGDEEYKSNFIPLPPNRFFNQVVYEKRIRISAEILLWEAESRARSTGKKAYIHVVGLGLGVWQVLKAQEQIYVDVFGQVISDNTFHHISDIHFSWIPVDQVLGVKNVGILKGGITVHFSKRDFFQKLPEEHSHKLLIVSWAYDGNSYPGNEFWMESLNSSGDPQAAASTQVSELLNPMINPFFGGKSLRVVSGQFGGVYTYEDFKKLKTKPR